MWIVGSTSDGTNDKIFHHLKIQKADGAIVSSLYKNVATVTGTDYLLRFSDKNLNGGSYIWSCG